MSGKFHKDISKSLQCESECHKNVEKNYENTIFVKKMHIHQQKIGHLCGYYPKHMSFSPDLLSCISAGWIFSPLNTVGPGSPCTLAVQFNNASSLLFWHQVTSAGMQRSASGDLIKHEFLVLKVMLNGQLSTTDLSNRGEKNGLSDERSGSNKCGRGSDLCYNMWVHARFHSMQTCLDIPASLVPKSSPHQISCQQM